MPSCLSSAFLLLRTVADRQLVVAASDEAAAMGIRRGMTLTQARALCADVQFADHDPQRDRHALEALGRWMMRFSPVVACGTGLQAVSPKPSKKNGLQAHAADALFLDLTGCEQLFGGIETIVANVCDSMAQFRIGACVAVAPTPGAAWALAYSGKHRAIVTPSMLQQALEPLPVYALRLDEEICACLNHLGLHTIGQLMHLPRQVLPVRFGHTLLRRLDEATGRIPEPLVPLEYRPPIQARVDWDGAVSSLELIWLAFQKLIGRVIAQLVRRGCGARRLEVELLRAHCPPVKKTIFLSRPSTDPVNLFNLFRCALEDLNLPLRQRRRDPGRDSIPVQRNHAKSKSIQIIDEGFSGLRITVPLFERMTGQQIALLEHDQYRGQAELDRLIERLRVRLGSHSITRAELVESYVPENAWRKSEESETAQPDGLRTDLPARPLHLFPTPLQVPVIVTPSEDAQGSPAAFTFAGQMREVLHAVGPERIAGRWWNGHDKTRDYFDVADAIGQRFWLFRVTQTGRWYLHGSFE